MYVYIYIYIYINLSCYLPGGAERALKEVGRSNPSSGRTRSGSGFICCGGSLAAHSGSG